MYSERGKRPLPELRPYPGQVDAALRLVHLRRRRSAALAASAAGLVVVASLLVTARGSGLAVVEPAAPFPLPSATSRAGTAPAFPATAPSAGPAASQGPALAVSPHPSVAAAVPSHLASPGIPSPSAVPPSAERRAPVRRHMMRKPAACAASVGSWCAYVVKTSKDDVPWFQMVACNPASAAPTRLSFELEREVDFAIVDTATGDEVWRWSSIEPEPAEALHSITAEVGWCYVWTAVWNGLGDDGRPLPPGDYVVRAEVLGRPTLADDTEPWQQG